MDISTAEESPLEGQSLNDLLRVISDLRHAGRFDEADTVARHARRQFKSDAAPALEYARIAVDRRDWQEAARRWADVRTEFPERIDGPLWLAVSQRELGSFGEAQATLEEGVTKFAKQPELLFELARTAEAQNDWAEAAKRWQRARLDFPVNPEGYVGEAAALRRSGHLEAAKRLLAKAAERFPDDRRVQFETCISTHQQRDWAEAVRRWAVMRAKFPNDVSAHTLGAIALRELGRFEEADTLLVSAGEKFPDDFGVANEFAWLAVHRRDWQEALGRWDTLCRRFPDRPGGYTGVAMSLRELQRLDEAEGVLSQAIARFPTEMGPRVDCARIAELRGDWSAAATRWAEVRTSFADNPAGWAEGARALIASGNIQTAESLLSEALTRFPAHEGAAIAWAECASRNRDWVTARERWDIIRERFPDHPAGYLGSAIAMRQLGAAEQAEELLRSARVHFPQDIGVSIEYAWLAHHRRDWEEATLRWDVVRQQFPTHLSGYTGAAVSLREASRFDEAEEILAEATERFQNDAAPLIERAMVAHVRRDLVTSVARWEEIRRRFPHQLVSYTMGSLDLLNLNRDADAEALIEAALVTFPDNAELLIEYARLAERRGRWNVAAERWGRVCDAFPDRLEGYCGAATALSSDGRANEADQVLETGMSHFPAVAQLASDYAWVAYRQKRWEEAKRRFAVVRERFPEDPSGYRGGAEALSSTGQLVEAEELLEAGMNRLSDPHLALTHALIPVSPLLRERDRNTAIARLNQVCDRYPEFEQGYVVTARLMRECGRLDEAEKVASRGLGHRTRSAELGIEYAKIAQEKENWSEAIERFRAVTNKFPDQSIGKIGLAEALSLLEHFEEAELLLNDAIVSFPNEPGPFIAHARLAMRRGEAGEALRRWSAAAERFPSDEVLRQQLFEARLHALEIDPAAAELVNSGRDEVSAVNMASLMTSFESLGGTLPGCEFGLVQRSFGGEPLGLLRWTDMEPADLIGALEARFEGVGLPENTELLDSGDEYGTRDVRFGMRMHTFVPVREVSREQMYARACRRLQFLRDKFLDDLEDGSKIFVYRLTERNLDPEELGRIRRAMQRYSQNALLYVRYSDADHAAGTVEVSEPGLLIGYIEHFSMSAAGQPLELALHTWAEICRRAHRLWSQASALNDQAAETVQAEAEREEAKPANARELVLRFESLGGSGHGCEFGIFQRENGAEPLGLLRWADLAHHFLASALETNFEGVGQPEHTELLVPHDPNGHREYWTRDRRYWMAMRTFVLADDVPQDEMLRRACRRLQFLREKLIADLRSAEKIFVYKVLERNLSPKEIKRIHRAMRRYGENTLLYVRYADDTHPDGTVELPQPGLMIGYVDRFSYSADDVFLGSAAESWLRICESAYDLWSSALPSGGGSRRSDSGDLSKDAAPSNDQDRASPQPASADLANDEGPAIEHAWSVHQSGNWEEAERCWRDIRDRFSGHLAAYTAGAECLERLGRDADADSLLVAAGKMFPTRAEPSAQQAWRSHRRKDFVEAIRLWEELRRRFPDHPLGYSGGASSLREANRPDDAEALLSENIPKLPLDMGLLVEWAWVAHHRRDWAEAARRWSLIREKFPNNLQGYSGGVASFRDAASFSEAEALLNHALRHWPDDLGLLMARASLAEHRHNWDEAVSQWVEVRKRFPTDPVGHLHGARALEAAGRTSEAIAVLDEATTRWPSSREVLGTCAELAFQRRDFEKAIEFGKELIRQFPGNQDGFFHASRSLREIGRIDETEELLKDTSAELPNAADTLSIWASLATIKRDWPEAERRWRLLQERFPAEPKFVWHCANALLQRDETAQADAMLTEGRTRFPDNPEIAMVWMDVALRTGDWTLVAARAADVRQALPGEPIGYLVGARALRELGKFDHADELIGQALERFPGHEGVARAKAGLPRPVSPPSKRGREVDLAWSRARVEQVEHELATRPVDSREYAFASIYGDVLRGDRVAARRKIEVVRANFAHLYPHEGYTFSGLVIAALVSCQWDLATQFINDHFGREWCLGLDVGDKDLPSHAVRWNVSDNSRFLFSPHAFTHDRTREEFFQWVRTLPLFVDYPSSPGAQHGSVVANLGDNGVAPGLAFCDGRPEYFLVPDNSFLSTQGYSELRARLATPVPWGSRKPVVFWRGSSTGIRTADWRTLQRVQLCEVAATAEMPALFDIFIDNIVGLTPEWGEELKIAGLWRPYEGPAKFEQYKYQIDIDGNTNSWPGLFQKLYTGSPVLKVESRLGFRQWYYEDLQPWVNFVPVAADMSDFVEKATWLHTHDDEARMIGVRGRELVERMTFENELKRGWKTVGQAIRYFSKQQ